MLGPMFHLARAIGSKAQHGDNMRGIERVHQPDPLAAAVFAQIQSIVGEEPAKANTAAAVRHVSVEEAINELLAMQNASAQCAPSALQ